MEDKGNKKKFWSKILNWIDHKRYLEYSWKSGVDLLATFCENGNEISVA
jgi:hypothetical protein